MQVVKEVQLVVMFLTCMLAYVHALSTGRAGHTNNTGNHHNPNKIRINNENDGIVNQKLGKLPDNMSRISVLCHDPVVYTVENMLSPDECEQYIARALSSPDLLVRSNAPEAGVDVSRLWPLPFLVLGTGLPAALRVVLELDSISEISTSLSSDFVSVSVLPLIFSAIKLPVGIAAFITTILVAFVNYYAKSVASSSRTSSSLALNQEQDCEFIRPLMERTYAITGHEWSNWEAPVVTRYRPGESFGMHNDASPTKGSEWADKGGQRVVTIITYLNTVPDGSGGQTRFDRLNKVDDINIYPQAGKSCVFFPANDKSLDMDDRTRHESVAMNEIIVDENDKANEKWIVQLFGRIERVPPPLGIPEPYESEKIRC